MNNHFISQMQWQLFRTIEKLGHLGNMAVILMIIAAAAYLLVLRPLSGELDVARLLSDNGNAIHSEKQPKSEADMLNAYLAAFPSVSTRASAIQSLMDLAEAEGVQLNEVAYKSQTRPEDPISHYHVEFGLFDTYTDIQHFLSTLLHQLSYVSIESLTFSRETINDEDIEARIHLVFHFNQL